MIPERIQFGEMVLMAGNANPELAAKVAAELGQGLEDALVSRFADGEIRVDLDAVVRGTDVFIIQPISPSYNPQLEHFCSLTSHDGQQEGDGVCHYQSVNDNLMELLVMIDAVRRASAGRITAVVPYLGYAKQEKKKRGHEPITAKLVANLITVAGADRLLTIDLHTPAIEGFFDIPVDHMRMAFLMASYYAADLARDAVVVSPDAGGVARATEFRDHLKRGMDHVADELAVAFKRRGEQNEPMLIEMVGDVAGRPAIIYDDMIQSGGTLLQVVERLLERGAREVHAAAVHADLAPGAIEALRRSPLSSLALTDTIASARELAGPGIHIVTSARILAQAIWRIHTQKSIGWIFNTLRADGALPPVDRNGP